MTLRRSQAWDIECENARDKLGKISAFSSPWKKAEDNLEDHRLGLRILERKYVKLRGGTQSCSPQASNPPRLVELLMGVPMFQPLAPGLADRLDKR